VPDSSPDSSPQPNVFTTVPPDHPDLLSARGDAKALEHQQQRHEGIAHLLQRHRLQREARRRKALARCQANGTGGLSYAGLQGDDAYRVLLADWHGVRREINEALPRLLRRSQRLRAATTPAATSVPRTVAPRRTSPPGGRPRAHASRSSSRSGDSPDDASGEPSDADLASPPAVREGTAA
jgi:hypothetical protein